MKNIKLTLLGTAALLIAVGLNIRHALNDYGVRDNKLHVEVLAQSNGSGGGGSTDGGDGGSTDGDGGQKLKKIKTYCTCYKNGSYTGMRIIECEEYTWFPPMVRTTCVLTNCPYGSSCW